MRHCREFFLTLAQRDDNKQEVIWQAVLSAFGNCALGKNLISPLLDRTATIGSQTAPTRLQIADRSKLRCTSTGCGRINRKVWPFLVSWPDSQQKSYAIDFVQNLVHMLSSYLNGFSSDIFKPPKLSQIFRCLSTVKQKLAEISIRSPSQSASWPKFDRPCGTNE